MSEKMKKAIGLIVEGSGLAKQFEEAIAKQEEFHLCVTASPFMPLVIEVVGGDVSVCHTFIQQGDVMRDPEIVFNGQTWVGVEYTQDTLGYYERVPHGKVSDSIETFADVWATSLIGQGFASPESATYESLTHTL